MKRRVAIFIAGWFFAGGIVFASFLPKNFLFFGIYYFALSIVFFVLSAVFWQRKNMRAVWLWAAFLFLGIWRLSISLPVDSPDKIFHYNGNKVELIGLVSAQPVNKGRSQKLEIESLLINNPPLVGEVKTNQKDVSGKVLVLASPYPRYNFGDVLRITCKIKRPDKIENFDYEKYLAAQDIYSTCSFPKIYFLKENNLSVDVLAKKKSLARFNWMWSGIFKVREKLSATIDNGLAEPEAGLLKAFLLNDPTVPEDLNDSFRKSGLSHIVAISGSHISELIGIAFFLLLFLGVNRRLAFWFCVPMIIFYVTMIGAPASATRAGVMGVLVLLAVHLGRLARLDYALVLAGVAMLLFNPMLVIADAGFQLSFLAILGMIYLYPIFDKWLARFYENESIVLSVGADKGKFFLEGEGVLVNSPPWRGARRAGWVTNRGMLGGVIDQLKPYMIKVIKFTCQAFALTVAAQIFTAPILIFGFHQISLIAPLANLFALWAAPLIMISALVAMGLSLIFPIGAIIFFIPAGLLEKYLILVAQISANLPLAYWKF